VVIEIVETITFDSDQRALGITRDVLASLHPLIASADAAILDRALAIARIVAHFDPDPVAIAGTLVQACRSAGLVLDDAALASLDPAVAAFATALARLARTDLPVRGTAHRYTAAQAEGLRRMLLAVVADPRLVLARVSEQLWRLRAARHASDEDKAHLGRETQELYAPLANRLGLASLKWELEDFAFRYLSPEEYKRIAESLAEKRADRERYIDDLKAHLEAALKDAGIAAEVQGRPKHLYSIFRKMQKKSLRFEELYDVRAVRILVSTVAECYAALGVVHSHYAYLAGEFDDYIATPKPNGYRSIHTAVVGPAGKTVEVQIRTREMHERAEMGVAAHWRYKEGGRRDGALERKVEDLRRLLQPSASDDDPLARVGQVVFRERVYVFSPKGDVVELTEGATPLDFAYQVHTSLGHRCRGARVDGRMVPLNHRLTNGVTVEVITAKEAQPSRDWMIDSLGFLASKSAKAKVRAWFRAHDRDDHLRGGRAIAERELGRRFTLAELEWLATQLNVPDAEELCVALGAGDLSAGQLSAALERRDRAQLSEAESDKLPVSGSVGSAPEAAAGIHVMGVGDLLSHYARCCNPVPPEAITGYVTLGRGVTIHRSGCRNLLRLGAQQPDRLVPVTWGQQRDQLYAVDFQVRAFDRRGLVRDVSSLLADARLSIHSMTTTTNAEGIAEMRVATRVHDLDELELCLARIRGLPDIIRAQRN
jgi:GTP pyrophosphokinase